MNKHLPSLKNTVGSKKCGPGRQRRLSFFLWIRACAIKSYQRNRSLCLSSFALFPLTLEAAVFEVNTLSDSSAAGLSLRSAIAQASGNDTIIFDPLLADGTLQLTQGEIVIDADGIAVVGPADGPITISASSSSRIFNVPSGSNASLSNLVLTGGSPGFERGGAILNEGRLFVTNCLLSGNETESVGGAIANNNGGSLTITNSSLVNNFGGYNGGAISSVSSTLSLYGCTLSGNRGTGGEGGGGGAINSTSSETTIINSTITGNSTGLYGGGVYSGGPGFLSIANSIISGNYSDSVERRQNISEDGRNALNEVFSNGIPLMDDTSNLIAEAPSTIFASTSTFTTPEGNTFEGGALADNGGNIPTVLISEGGPARSGSLSSVPLDILDLDNDNDTSEPLPFDARGLLRISGGSVDIGALEIQENVDVIELECDGDLDQDGKGNLLEFIIGTNPLVADAGDPRDPVLSVDDDGLLNLRFGRAANLPGGLSFQILRSFDLTENSFVEVASYQSLNDVLTINPTLSGLAFTIDGDGFFVFSDEIEAEAAFYQLRLDCGGSSTFAFP